VGDTSRSGAGAVEREGIERRCWPGGRETPEFLVCEVVEFLFVLVVKTLLSIFVSGGYEHIGSLG